jgi:dynein heavy chain
VRDQAEIKRQLADTESKILKVLSETDDILGDAAAIEVLQQASLLSVEIGKKEEKAKITEAEIDEARVTYKPIALRTAGLFFCIQDLAFMNFMYQYSLPFFVVLFEASIADAPASEDIDERLENLNKTFLESLYRNICRSLFEKDKTIFSFLLAIKLKELNNEVSKAEMLQMLTGGVDLGANYGDPPAPWISKKMWGELKRACDLPSLKRFLPHFMDKLAVYETLYDHKNPETWNFPEEAPLKAVGRLLVFRAIRPDKFVPMVSRFICEEIGDYYIQPPPFDLALIYGDSKNITPLIFVLSPGSDPMNGLQNFT